LPSFRQWIEEKQDPPNYSTPNVEVKCEHPKPKVQPVKPHATASERLRRNSQWWQSSTRAWIMIQKSS